MNTLYVVGIGPGSEDDMTIKAWNTLKSSDVIVGYKGYVDLVRNMTAFADKKFLETGMRSEVERCHMALELVATTDQKVAFVCSGDSGIYGMASILYELAVDYTDVELEIIPGVTAASSGSALLGAPIGHDTAIISLSDLLTPYELIVARLKAAAQADMCIVLYNPASHKRPDYLKKACRIVLEYKAPETICGIARNIGRPGSDYELTTLDRLGDADVDMFCTVFIGNSHTLNIDGHMVTPRGYNK